MIHHRWKKADIKWDKTSDPRVHLPASPAEAESLWQ